MQSLPARLPYRILRIYSCARIVVPPPDSSKTGAGLYDLCFESLFAKLVKKIDTREAASNNYSIQIVTLGLSISLSVSIDAISG